MPETWWGSSKRAGGTNCQKLSSPYRLAGKRLDGKGLGLELEHDADRIITSSKFGPEVFIFDYDGEKWDQTAVLTTPVEERVQWFGYDLALSSDLAVIGANDFRARVYKNEEGTWRRVSELYIRDSWGTGYASVVAILGERAFVGFERAGVYVFDDFSLYNNVAIEGAAAQDDTGLKAIYPSPARHQVTFQFHLFKGSTATIKVVDVLGRERGIPIEGFFTAGMHEVTYNIHGLSAGVYYCNFQTPWSDEARGFIVIE